MYDMTWIWIWTWPHSHWTGRRLDYTSATGSTSYTTTHVRPFNLRFRPQHSAHITNTTIAPTLTL